MYKDLTSAEVIADSTWDGVRLTTFRATFPRFILAEVNTHRAFSRNSASSRAIPVKRQIELVEESPFVPQQWPKNQTGMSAKENVAPYLAEHAEKDWLSARDEMVAYAESLSFEYGVHKQIASRLLEPFMWHTAIISSTQAGLNNFFLQRDHEDAQPEMQVLARAMRKALDESTPMPLPIHIPFLSQLDSENDEEEKFEALMIRAVARCARVSYGRELEEKAYEEDVALVERLIRSGHWSPLEQVSAADTTGDLNHAGNFSPPWAQLRHNWRRFLPSIAEKIDSNVSTGVQ